MKISFEPEAIEQLNYWITTKPRTAARIMDLIKDMSRTPYEGKGKPEALKYDLSVAWSRRIDKEHRLVYTINNDQITIISCKYHY